MIGHLDKEVLLMLNMNVVDFAAPKGRAASDEEEQP